jgi:hypothetical protein
MNNEPVAWMNPETLECGLGGNVDWEDTGCIPLYTHPNEADLGIAEAIGFDKGYKAATAKTLTDEEILCLWDWWSGEILATDILDFADTYKRALLGEEGLLEWHQEYVKRMNNETT